MPTVAMCSSAVLTKLFTALQKGTFCIWTDFSCLNSMRPFQSLAPDRKWLHTFGYGLHRLHLLRCYTVQPGCVGFDTPERLLDQGYLSSQIDSFIYFMYIQNRFVCFLWRLTPLDEVKHCRTAQDVVTRPGLQCGLIVASSTPGFVVNRSSALVQK